MKATNSIQDFVKSSAILGRIKTPTPFNSPAKSKKEELVILAYFEKNGHLPDKIKLSKTLIFTLHQVRNSTRPSHGLDYDFLGLELYKRCEDKESARKAIRLFSRVSRLSIKPTQIDLALDIPLPLVKGLSSSRKKNCLPKNNKKYPSTSSNLGSSYPQPQSQPSKKPSVNFRFPYFTKYGKYESDYSDDLQKKLAEWPSLSSKVYSCIKEFRNSYHELEEDPIHRK
jgi:hypothetical protein